MATPKALQYSSALKPVSIPVRQQSRRFLPTSSGPYNVANNIIRIPINSNNFLDMKNAMLKFQLQNNSGGAVYLDGCAGSIVSELRVESPDGANLNHLTNYNKIYNALIDMETSIDCREGYQNLLQGASTDDVKYSVRTTGTAFELAFYANNVNVGNLVLGNVGSVRLGNFLFESNANNDRLIVNGTELQLGTAFSQVIGGVHFASGVAGSGLTLNKGADFAALNANVNAPAAGARLIPAGALYIDGQLICVSGTPTPHMSAVISHATREHTAMIQSEVFANNETKTYCIPLFCGLTKLETLFPAFLIGNGGITLQITLPNSNDQVFFSAKKNVAPVYEVSSVELLVPVLNYPDNIIADMRNMVNSLGSLSMSTVDFQCFTYPYAANEPSISIPIAVKKRSLKALYFFFQSNQSASDYTVPRTSAREALLKNDSTYQFKIGSEYFPASAVKVSNSSPAEVVTELLKSVSKLNDMRLGTYLSKDNFFLTQAQGGLAIYGIDLEGLQNEYMESGLNTAQNSLATFLEISGLGAHPAGMAYVFACYDSSYSILANGNCVATS